MYEPTASSRKKHSFHPERHRGTWFYGAMLFLAVAAAIFAGINLISAVGLAFAGYLTLTIVTFILIPMIATAMIGLFRAEYVIDRESLLLKWGGRVERIPIGNIEWVRTFDSLGLEMHVPRFHQFGIVRGVVHNRELGNVEFMSDTVVKSIFIATPDRVFVISPTDMPGFIAEIRDAMESGSLSEAKPVSLDEETALKGIWQQPVGRLLLVSLLVCNLALLVIVQMILGGGNGSVLFQQQAVISLASLRLMPFVSLFFGLVDFTVGMIFYQRKKDAVTAYLLWGAGSLLPVLLSVSIALAG